MKKIIIMIIFSLHIFLIQISSDELSIITMDLSLDGYIERYYDLAIEKKIKPEGFIVSREIAQEIFKMLVEKYYDITYTEDIIIREYKEYYIITGSKNAMETGYEGIIQSSNKAITMILKIADGTVISVFVER